jgi:hypothetical protein
MNPVGRAKTALGLNPGGQGHSHSSGMMTRKADQTNAGLNATWRCSLFPVVPGFCNYHATTPIAVDNRKIREHARTGNKP